MRLLVLHGDKQTGELLSGRMQPWNKRMVSTYGPNAVMYVDGMHELPLREGDDLPLRCWWSSDDGELRARERKASLELLEGVWSDAGAEGRPFSGVVGFSQGGLMAGLMATATTRDTFPGLQLVIVAGAPDMEGLGPSPSILSLHIIGGSDKLVPPASSEALAQRFMKPRVHRHEGGHHFPVKRADVDAYMQFLGSVPEVSAADEAAVPAGQVLSAECAAEMAEEDEALQMIYPSDEICLPPPSSPTQPVRVRVCPAGGDQWPPGEVWLVVTRGARYPHEPPHVDIDSRMGATQFRPAEADACLRAAREAAEAGAGMAAVASCLMAAQMALADCADARASAADAAEVDHAAGHGVPGPDEAALLQDACAEGLSLAHARIQGPAAATPGPGLGPAPTADGGVRARDRGGVWAYTIGLVGKPSAGKSTVFNAATGFSRQRGGASPDTVQHATAATPARGVDGGQDGVEVGVVVGGAKCGATPFTTIDPNMGVAWVPLPVGLCPEDAAGPGDGFASAYGRDQDGRRLVQVRLVDVAGLVPGANEGRGKGNRFLNDLTTADVLVHVVDASGTADSEGNAMAGSGAHTVPLSDIAWLRDEIVQWIFQNVWTKFGSVLRRGADRLTSLFTGYHASRGFVEDLLLALDDRTGGRQQEDELHRRENHDRHASHKNSDGFERWGPPDVMRLVSLFQAVRFPTVLALNKADLPSSVGNIKEVMECLPCHGATVGVPMCAAHESQVALGAEAEAGLEHGRGRLGAVRQALSEAMRLRPPVVVFPVGSLETLEPLPGMPWPVPGTSFPNTCTRTAVTRAGGWVHPVASNRSEGATDDRQHAKGREAMLRDAVLMRPGSTVDDLFLHLKGIGAVSGEYVRAEAMADVGGRGIQLRKDEVLGPHNRIIRVMTNRKSRWQ